MTKLLYRPEIDGLRAIAVLGVIFYHAGISITGLKIFEGGFIGVDIFFVISGYLITSIILKEINTTNNFSIQSFYQRRARRILPMVFFVIFISIFFAWFYLLPKSLLEYSKSIISSALFFSNYFFYFQDLVYNADISLLKPLLHTWSLAVEEQFYIIFPIFIVFIFKFFKGNYLFFLLVGFISSLLFSNYYTNINPSLSFFSLFSRSWELLAGSLLAYSEIYKKKGGFKYDKYLPTIGLIIILISLFLFNENTKHPSFITLIPVIGVSLIIYFSNENEISYKILSNKIPVSIGLISYSLYLWHFPIFAFARNRGKDLSDYDKFELFLLTFLLSILSYFIIEKPFRNKNFLSFKKISLILILFLTCFGFFSIYSIKNNGFEDRIHVFLKRELRINMWEKMQDSKGLCFDRANEFCSFNPSMNKKIYLIGDSHMEDISENLFKKIKNIPINYISMNRGGCIYLPTFDKINRKTNKSYGNCSLDSQSLIRQQLLENQNSIVILGGSFNAYFKNNDPEFEFKNNSDLKIIDGFKNSIDEILSNNITVLLVYPIPAVGWHVPRRLMNEIPKNTYEASEFLKKNKFTTELDDYFLDNNYIFDFFNQIKHPNLLKVFPHKVFCDEKSTKKCFTHDEKNIFYIDGHHLSNRGAELLVNEIIKVLGKNLG